MLTLSCENNPVGSGDETITTSSNLQVIDGIVHISSKSALTKMGKDYQNNVEGQNSFNKSIRNLQKSGFKPLLPLFADNDSEKIKQFLQEKYARKKIRDKQFGYNRRDPRDLELDLDDEIISDPFMTCLLNENREIVVGNDIYKYTELGLYYVAESNKQTLYDFLNNMTPAERQTILARNNSAVSTTDKPQEIFETVGNGITSFRVANPPRIADIDGNDGSGSGPGSGGGPPNDGNIGGVGGTGSGTVVTAGSSSSGGTGTGTTYGDGVFNPANFGSCSIETQSWWEMVFGEQETCYDYYNDDKRAKVTFWNENYLIFASVGINTRFQKKETIVIFRSDFLGVNLTITYWEKSYAEKVRLGTNFVEFNYNFNVPVYSQAAYNYNTTFFEYNGTKYNINGQVIPTVPTGAGNFNFSVNNQNNVISIIFMGDNIGLNNGQVNQVIDGALDVIISKIQSTDVKQELTVKKAAGDLEVKVVYAPPSSDSVKFIIGKQNWSSNNDNAISHYFDFNFLISWSSDGGNTSTSDVLNGLKGSTSYSVEKVDIFGATLHNNFWKGRRLVK